MLFIGPLLFSNVASAGLTGSELVDLVNQNGFGFLNNSGFTLSGTFDGHAIPTLSYGSYEAIGDALDNKSLGNWEQSATANSPNFNSPNLGFTDLTLSVRGVPLEVKTVSGSNAIVMDTLGVHQTFDSGQTRSENLKAAYEYLKTNKSDFLDKLNVALAGQSYNSALAGNPTSLQSISIAADGNIGATSGNGRNGENNRNNISTLSFNYTSYTIANNNANVYTLPLGHTWNFDNGYGLIFDMPVTMVENHYFGSTTYSYNGSLGLGLRIPMSKLLYMQDTWELTPILRGGAAGSTDLGEYGALWSTGLTSHYGKALWQDYRVDLRNTVSFYQTIPIKIKDDTIDANINNVAFRNSIQFGSLFKEQWKILGNRTGGSVFFTDTHITGNALYIDNYQEVGFDIGVWSKPKPKAPHPSGQTDKTISEDIKQEIADLRSGKSDLWQSAKIGFTYVIIDKNSKDGGFNFNMGYSF